MKHKLGSTILIVIITFCILWLAYVIVTPFKTVNKPFVITETSSEVTVNATLVPTPDATVVPTTEPTTEPTIEATSTPTTEVIQNTSSDSSTIKVIVCTPNSTTDPASTPITETTPATITDNSTAIKVVVCTPNPTTTASPTPVDKAASVDGIFKLHQIYVGCGDAYLLQSGDISIMVDGGQKDSSSGGKNVRQRVLNYLENQGVTTIDAYIGTHWHGDHVENMSAILEKFGNNNTIVYGNSPKLPSKYYIPSGKGTYKQMVDGDTMTFGDIVIKCMGPYKLFSGENHNSLNFMVTFGQNRILMTGDYVHKEILDKYSDELKNIDVYKMAHHGLKVSNYSGSPDVLPHLNPDVVLVPANSSAGTKDLLSSFGISSKIYDGKGQQHVIVQSDGEKITVTIDK